MNGHSDDYIQAMQNALSLIRPEEVASGLALLRDARRGGQGVFICGNGGSAATASHLAVDLGRSTGRGMRAIALTGCRQDPLNRIVHEIRIGERIIPLNLPKPDPQMHVTFL